MYETRGCPTISSNTGTVASGQSPDAFVLHSEHGGIKSKGYKYAGSNRLSDVGWYWQNSGDHYLLHAERL